MKRAKSLGNRFQPWAVCALVAVSSLSKPVLAEDNKQKERATSLRTEAKGFEHGVGNPRNSEKAVELYCEAARLGDAEAQYNLGWMYAMGRGIPRDDATAAYFFSRWQANRGMLLLSGCCVRWVSRLLPRRNAWRHL